MAVQASLYCCMLKLKGWMHNRLMLNVGPFFFFFFFSDLSQFLHVGFVFVISRKRRANQRKKIQGNVC